VTNERQQAVRWISPEKHLQSEQAYRQFVATPACDLTDWPTHGLFNLFW